MHSAPIRFLPEKKSVKIQFNPSCSPSGHREFRGDTMLRTRVEFYAGVTRAREKIYSNAIGEHPLR